MVAPWWVVGGGRGESKLAVLPRAPPARRVSEPPPVCPPHMFVGHRQRTDTMPTISAQIPEDDEAALKEVAALMDADKRTVIRKALRAGLTELRNQTPRC